MQNPSELITGDASEGDRYFMSVAYDSAVLKVWRCSASDPVHTFREHMAIRTSLESGIRWVLHTSPAQIVCVDNDKTLKYYDFVHKKV